MICDINWPLQQQVAGLIYNWIEICVISELDKKSAKWDKCSRRNTEKQIRVRYDILNTEYKPYEIAAYYMQDYNNFNVRRHYWC
jgi:hypothetical protein